MTNPFVSYFNPPGDTTNRTPKMLAGIRSKPVVNGEPPPPTGTTYIPDVDVTIADGGDTITLTTQPAGATEYWARSIWFDTRAFNQMRVVLDDVEQAGAATSRVRARYKTTVGGTFSDPGPAGSEISASMAVAGPVKSGWVVLDPGAIGDILLHADAIGGDGSASPVVGGVHFQFRQSSQLEVPPMGLCPVEDGGCPLPSVMYNGEDFSVERYADEAAFISYVEAESDNRYWVWYGDDGGEEGCSYDPDLTFCGNPVVVGRWKAVSDGSNIWDITGFGCWTRFSSPVGDTGGSGFPPRVGFAYVWATIRLKIESGWTADDGTGFTLSDLQHGGNGINGNSAVRIRDGRIIFGCQADISVSYEEFDIGPASMLVGTADFMDLTIHGTLSDIGGGLWNVQTEVFVNVSCDVATPGDVGSESATPRATYTADVVPTPIGGTVSFLKFYDWDKFNYTTDTAQWPEKKIWVAQWCFSGSLT